MNVIEKVVIPKVLSNTEYEIKKKDFTFGEKIKKKKDFVYIYKNKHEKNIWHLDDISLRLKKDNPNMLYIFIEKDNIEKNINILIGNTFDLINSNFSFKFSKSLLEINLIRNKILNIIRLTKSLSSSCSIRIYNIDLSDKELEIIVCDDDIKTYNIELDNNNGYVKQFINIPQRELGFSTFLKYLSPFFIAFFMYQFALFSFQIYYEEPINQIKEEEENIEKKSKNLKTEFNKLTIEKQDVLSKERVIRQNIVYKEN